MPVKKHAARLQERGFKRMKQARMLDLATLFLELLLAKQGARRGAGGAAEHEQAGT
jgi:hypothetical protein